MSPQIAWRLSRAPLLLWAGEDRRWREYGSLAYRVLTRAFPFLLVPACCLRPVLIPLTRRTAR